MEHFSNVSDWVTGLFYSGLAAFGGALGYAMRENAEGKRVNKGRLVLEAAASGFVGLLVMFACKEMGLSPMWSGFVVGVCGWLGAASSIRIIERLIYRKLDLKMNDKGEVE